jgi:hypothetical protein
MQFENSPYVLIKNSPYVHINSKNCLQGLQWIVTTYQWNVELLCDRLGHFGVEALGPIS